MVLFKEQATSLNDKITHLGLFCQNTFTAQLLFMLILNDKHEVIHCFLKENIPELKLKVLCGVCKQTK